MLYSAREYFIEIAKDLGYKSHPDVFNFENIPSSNLDKSFHVESFNFNGLGHNQTDLSLGIPVTVRLFFKSYLQVEEGIKKAINSGETYFTSCLVSENRLNNTIVKNVVLDSMVVEPYSVSNDNYVVCRMDFTATIFKGIC